jgi:hypothetical protein
VLASFILLVVNQVDVVDIIDGVDEVDGVDSPALTGSICLVTTKLLILMLLCIISLTARFKTSDVQAVTRYSKTQ